MHLGHVLRYDLSDSNDIIPTFNLQSQLLILYLNNNTLSVSVFSDSVICLVLVFVSPIMIII